MLAALGDRVGAKHWLGRVGASCVIVRMRNAGFSRISNNGAFEVSRDWDKNCP